MKKIVLILCLFTLAGWQSAYAATFRPAFEADYNSCGNMPVISANSVTFGSGSECKAGSYFGVTNIEVDASGEI